MGVEKKETALFTYLVYRREQYSDFDAIKKELSILSSKLQALKDIILDLTCLSNITSAEIGAIVRLIINLKGSTRILRIILSPSIVTTFESTQISKLENVILYRDKNSFVNELKSLAAARPEK